MKLTLLALVLLAFLSPTTPYVEWALWTCTNPATVILKWVDPPANVAPFVDGLLFVWDGPDGDTYMLKYQGWYINNQGEIVHEWVATYPRPGGVYELDAYVKNSHGVIFWVDEMLTPVCAIYLPMVTGGM